MPIILSESAKVIADEFYQFYIRNTPNSIFFGEKESFNVPQISLEGVKTSAEYAKRILRKIEQVENPSQEDSILLAIIRFSCEEIINESDFYWNKIDVTPFIGYIPFIKNFLEGYLIEDAEDMKKYLHHLDSYAKYLEDLLSKTKEQVKMGIMLPKRVLPYCIEDYKNYIEDITKSSLLITENRLKFQTNRFILDKEISENIIKRINHAVSEIIHLLSGDYLDLAPEEFGYYIYPQGKDYYKTRVNFHATIKITPEEVLRRAEAERDRTLIRMEEIRIALGFDCDREEFNEIIINHAKWKLSTPEEFGNKLNEANEMIKDKLKDYFLFIPKTPCKAERILPALETTNANGYFSPPNLENQIGVYYYNGQDIDKKNPLKTAPMALHELLPGHHYQMSYIFEADHLHPLQKVNLFTANIEGWAEYASKLGGEMKVFDSLYYEYGKLEMDLYLINLLLVDVGVNYFEWSFEKAVDYLRPFLLDFSEERLIIQTMRIILGDPGYVISYKMGSLLFDELREKAERTLKESFDIREFNHTLIEWGSLPMSVLQQHVDWYINDKVNSPM